MRFFRQPFGCIGNVFLIDNFLPCKYCMKQEREKNDFSFPAVYGFIFLKVFWSRQREKEIHGFFLLFFVFLLLICISEVFFRPPLSVLEMDF